MQGLELMQPQNLYRLLIVSAISIIQLVQYFTNESFRERSRQFNGVNSYYHFCATGGSSSNSGIDIHHSSNLSGYLSKKTKDVSGINDHQIFLLLYYDDCSLLCTTATHYKVDLLMTLVCSTDMS